MAKLQLLRVLDANLNRSREGLRVCEEIARFVLEEKVLTRRLKKLRHAVSGAMKKMPFGLSELLAARDTRSDVGKKSSRSEKSRQDALGVFSADIQRVKESLRVLEETAKLFDPELSETFKKLRFETYALEQRAVPRLEALRDRRR